MVINGVDMNGNIIHHFIFQYWDRIEWNHFINGDIMEIKWEWDGILMG
jgi:hypothetical protein